LDIVGTYAATEDVPLWKWIEATGHDGGGIPAALHMGSSRKYGLGDNHYGLWWKERKGDRVVRCTFTT
jgi:hypothetical protein